MPGDIYAVCGTGPVSTIIKWFTYSVYSHVGVLCPLSGPQVSEIGGSPHQIAKFTNSGLWLYESTALRKRKCDFAGKIVKGVQVHDPVEIVRHRYPEVHHLYRLRNPMTSWGVTEMMEYLSARLGDRYDYAGAVGTVLPLIRLFFGDAPDRLFCSEMAAKALFAAGVWPDKPQPRTPGGILRFGVEEGIYEFQGEVLV